MRMVARDPKQAVQAAKPILGYLKGTDEVGIIYKKGMETREGEEFPGPREMGTWKCARRTFHSGRHGGVWRRNHSLGIHEASIHNNV